MVPFVGLVVTSVRPVDRFQPAVQRQFISPAIRRHACMIMEYYSWCRPILLRYLPWTRKQAKRFGDRIRFPMDLACSGLCRTTSLSEASGSVVWTCSPERSNGFGRKARTQVSAVWAEVLWQVARSFGLHATRFMSS